MKLCIHCGHTRDRHLGNDYACWKGKDILHTNYSSGIFQRSIQVIYEPKPVHKKSTVILFDKSTGRYWNEATK